MTLSIVVSYCSNEHCFINQLLEECTKMSDDIVVSYGSHLYNGEKENIEQINALQTQHPQVRFVEYEVSDNNYTGQGVNQRPIAYWHNMARWTGIQALHNKQWVLLLDSDEIPEGNIFKEWYNFHTSNNLLNTNVAYKIANYWYFKHPTNRAKSLEDSVLLIHYNHLTKHNIFGDMERDYLIQASRTKLQRQTKGLKGEVMAHHFSWVRSKEGLLYKIKNWGHANEYTKPESIINFIFKDDNVNDIIHNYTYDKVDNKYNIRL